ncbi:MULTISPECIES: TIGR04211 family SH3 domain-containing protein [unclassified Neptuniibacter]|jgi:SH3 domain protein|uniref:TIGR04211 family SH3 domain-containing protein n=1 Tax=unclassified Neptuniibacter TaxID=2630693 RepID=UPI0026E31E1A|nr:MULTISPECIES: TIGR04211 family SH3 domain-containing protein [unclassified Neptuniibacter]MDO6513702.1 TIGR04211 family SH3 domain-containing protein [Neptuniibacter sp. 2_MG-2023]MDO6593843.1 TIGR04211 family SH3 domain-containing protein [Neptuniibacter sp. 1_MG-2023]
MNLNNSQTGILRLSRFLVIRNFTSLFSQLWNFLRLYLQNNLLSSQFNPYNMTNSSVQTTVSMKKLILATILLFSASVHAEKGHIADDAMIYVHNGPSNQYRIITRIPSGSSVDILKRDPKTKYVQIRMSKGRIGWVEPTAVDPGDSISVRLPKLQSSLEESQITVAEQAAKIETLQSESGGMREKNQLLTSEVAELNATIKELNFKIESSDESNLMRWFTHGGLVALGGVILGLILPYFPKRRKRKDEWF